MDFYENGKRMRYMVVVEEGAKSFGAYVPDLPGCVAVGGSQEEVMQLIQEAIESHVEDIRSCGEAIPVPHSNSAFERAFHDYVMAS